MAAVNFIYSWCFHVCLCLGVQTHMWHSKHTKVRGQLWILLSHLEIGFLLPRISTRFSYLQMPRYFSVSTYPLTVKALELQTQVTWVLEIKTQIHRGSKHLTQWAITLVPDKCFLIFLKTNLVSCYLNYFLRLEVFPN